MGERKANRLIKEKSPYLQQHAYNPVDWYPWCEEAFERAKRENKPIFLSIGYSTCHWCHVMERESFEDEEIARILNENYIAIKVDREERPDIDALYMSVCQAMTGSGGWPLTIVMTPDKEPFFAGTYFPKESLYGRSGLKEILLRISYLWNENQATVISTAQKVIEHLKDSEIRSSVEGEIDEGLIHKGFTEILSYYDGVYGGFGNAPKFPIPHNLLFLLRYYRRTGKEKALSMVRETLLRMRLGGIWDHVGFGFHRYSTDRQWLLPHFEKMLYDNALLMMAYAEAYQLTNEGLFAQTVEEIAEYLRRDMSSPEGVFYSAEDADSEGEEGKFYTWSTKELEEILTPEELEIAFRVFNIETEGNFREEATGQKTGRNILHMKKTLEEYKEELGYEEESLKQDVEHIRDRLFSERRKRVRPLRDEKILTDWNALAIASFSKGGVALGKRDYIEIAKRCANFILENMFDEQGRLLHRYKDGLAAIHAFLEDYAYLIWGLTELYFTTLEGRYLMEAKRLTDFVLEHFWDEENLGFFHTPSFGEHLPVRRKEVYDGAVPSGNSVMAYNLIRLSRLLSIPDYMKKAQETLRAFSQRILSFPSAHTFSLIAIDLLVMGGFELIAVGDREKALKDLLWLQRNFLPEGTYGFRDEAFEGLTEFAKNLPYPKGNVAYYLCRDYTCKEPAESISEVINMLTF